MIEAIDIVEIEQTASMPHRTKCAGGRSFLLMSNAQYQTLRSVSDNHVFVICRDGRLYQDLPDHVRRRGRWQGMCRGAISSLRPEFWLDLEEQDYALVRT